MKLKFKIGDEKRYERKVREEDSANFADEQHVPGGGKVHPVYSTYALARDAEWTCRLFVLEMKEANEEGIGTMINVKHLSPALIGSNVEFSARVKKIEDNEIICKWSAFVGSRIIAEGEQGQKILKKEKIERLIKRIDQ